MTTQKALERIKTIHSISPEITRVVMGIDPA
jgi:hypothetical protein